jgi:hypothetical protein
MKATTAERLTPTEFVDVARTIAKGNPLQWLPLALEHFSPGIGRFLPLFEHFPFGLAGE